MHSISMTAHDVNMMTAKGKCVGNRDRLWIYIYISSSKGLIQNHWTFATADCFLEGGEWHRRGNTPETKPPDSLGTFGRADVMAFSQLIHDAEIMNHQVAIGPVLITRWWFQTFFIFTLYLGKISNLTNIFQMG